MLESLYSRFDKKARQRGVFKVETIGDCYMACTGLPKPREDHALVMAKFARDMIAVFEDLQISLMSRIGSQVMDLGLRVGIHSGPVTAGVLRGDRARFQLFGDTGKSNNDYVHDAFGPVLTVSSLIFSACPVNTASRMESNGVPMQIQISDATAALLREKNKGHWLTPRADMVVAKGKGEMQTYWLTSHADTQRTKSSSHEGSSTNMDLETEDLHEALEAVEQRLRSMGRLDEDISAASGHSDTVSSLQSALAKRVPSGRTFAAERVDV